VSPHSPLPIESLLPELLAVLRAAPVAVLQAPPGAGKTTRVPLALLDQPWAAGGRILMLEPRRLAVRAAARRMAQTLGEVVGQTVGYRIRLETKVSRITRIEVVTESILTRMIQEDPELSGVAAILFDEFHERSLDADLGLALALESQSALRPDLRILVMSATLDGDRVAALMGGAPVLTSQGRAFPVETHYLGPPGQDRWGKPDLAGATATAVRRALAQEPGSLLVFLPGMAEIRAVQRALHDGLPEQVQVLPLHGSLPDEAQQRAIEPAPPGIRKVVLATAIAETSLTIEGVRGVIDAGLTRQARFDPASGMTRLVTVSVSQAASAQRQGRAGRMAPGVCYRLWHASAQAGLPPFATPEIQSADLTGFMLELARWGVGSPADLALLDPPSAGAVAQARELLRQLEMLDPSGAITPHGAAASRLPLHPRLAHMVLKGDFLGLGASACDLAAVLEEGGLLLPGSREVDLTRHLALLPRLRSERHPEIPGLDRGRAAKAVQSARQMRRLADLSEAPPKAASREERAEAEEKQRPLAENVGLLLALAYPDRIGLLRPGSRTRYRLSGGGEGFFDERDEGLGSELIVAADLDGNRKQARIRLGARLDRAGLERACGDRIEQGEEVAWDSRQQGVVARWSRRLGSLILEERPLSGEGQVDPEAIAAALMVGIREVGLGCLPWDRDSERLRGRLDLLHRVLGDPWPAVDDEALLAGLDVWLAPWCAGMRRLDRLKKIDLDQALRGLLLWNLARQLDELAPTHVTVPSGSRIALDYTAEGVVLAVKLQEMFGASQTPTVAGGRVAVTIHLLSPARRPVAVTRDLPSFWNHGYGEVRKDLRGRYPKHPWPEDPWSAPATRRTKPSGT